LSGKSVMLSRVITPSAFNYGMMIIPVLIYDFILLTRCWLLL